MAKYHGRGGALLLGSANGGAAATVVNLTQWSIALDMDLADVTSIGDTFKSFVPGMKSAHLTASGFFADDALIPFAAFDQAQASGTVSAYLYPAGVGVAKYFSGAVWPKSVSVDDSVGGPVGFKVDAPFNGVVTRT